MGAIDLVAIDIVVFVIGVNRMNEIIMIRERYFSEILKVLKNYTNRYKEHSIRIKNINGWWYLRIRKIPFYEGAVYVCGTRII